MIRWFAFSCVMSAAIPAIHARAATDDEDPMVAPPAAAPAPEPPPPPPAVESSSQRRTAVYAVFGLGTPVGFVGLEGVRRLGSAFEISGGFGRGFLATSSQPHASAAQVIQWAMMPRFRAGGTHHALTLGAGISGGNTGSGGEWFCDGPCPARDYPLTYVLWGNVEIGTEHWWNGGFAMRTFVGYARGCTTSTCTSHYGAELSAPYAGIGFGYAF